MPWTIIAVAVGAMAAVEASKPIVIHHPGWMRLSCKNCGARLQAGMKECEYCRTDDIWLVPPRDEHVYPSSLPAREPTPAPAPYRASSEQERRRQPGYTSPSPAPSPWADPMFVAASYSAASAPSYEPPAPSPCSAPSFSSGGGGDFGGGGASGGY